jgi:hypothetical protein
MKRHQSQFDILAFPIFATDKNGCIFYKNDISKRVLGTMRKGSHIMRYLPNEILPEKSGLVLLFPPNNPGIKALVLIDENEYLFLCLFRLQYSDAETVASHLLSALGETPSALFQRIGETSKTICGKHTLPPRISRDILHLVTPFSPVAKLGDVIDALFEKTNTAFCALGYQIHSKLSTDFLGASPANVSLFDFLFLYGTLLYCTMKLSKNGKISVFMTSDPKENAHILSFETETSLHDIDSADVFALLRTVAPECALEIAAWEMCREGLYFQLYHLHTLPKISTLTCHLPYLAPSHIVHSPFSVEETSVYLEELFTHIFDMLQENDPF